MAVSPVVAEVPETAAARARAVHEDEMRAAVRTTGLVAGPMILACLLLWIGYDHLVEAHLVGTHLGVRLLAFGPTLICWGLLLGRRFGTRHAEGLVVAMCAVPQVAVAWMVAGVDHAFEGYLLGYSLIIFGCSVLLVARLRVTVALVAGSWLILLLALGAHGVGVTTERLATSVFYLGTASSVAIVGRVYRLQVERRELCARLALEAEQARTLALVEQLDRLSREDSLTGLANRRAWDEALERAAAIARRAGPGYAILLLDLDDFKDINDRHGHQRGDEVLAAVGAALVGRVRSADLVARVGGDEFAVLCPGTGLLAAHHLAEDLAEVVARVPGARSASVGAAVHRVGDDVDSVMARADRALYEAKDRRRRRELAPVG